MKWKCDKCVDFFDLYDIPEECPRCGAEDDTFSLVDDELIKSLKNK